ncbi:MAG: NADH:ubiquinone reductase (Na(+)-transporting) subunit F [Bacteroidales bacterium]|nr:NADH:ubiquinone reductase (Na(+)-transporting) subunit F [Bacteroidales bacterium]
MTTLISSIAVFFVVVALLVALLLVLRAKLMPSGKVTITINDDKRLTVDSGNSLISTLSEHGVYLPSACGGKGSCGQCRCRVVKGGGTILPTEVGFFSRREQRDGWRLGCQLKVKEDLSIVVPESVLSVKKWECTVVSSRNVATFIREFTVRLPEGERLSFRSGEYVQIDIPACKVQYGDIAVDEPYRDDWQRMGLFDLTMRNDTPCTRAYSMANHPAEGDIVTLNVRIATPPFDRHRGGFAKVNPGISSSYIWSLKPGDKVLVSGPYGDFHIKEPSPADGVGKEMMFIGGGAGMAPMRSHIFDLFHTRHTQRKCTFWYGGRSLKELFYIDDFEAIAQQNSNFEFHVALSDPQPGDNWQGYTGFIHQVIYDNYLSHHNEPEEVEYYLCGPGPMTAAVVSMLDGLGVPPENILFDDFGA